MKTTLSQWGISLVAVLLAAAAGFAEPADETEGTIEGIVIAKPERKALVVWADHADEPVRFIPHWRGGLPADGGGPDEQMVQTIREIPEGARVRVAWRFVEHRRVEAMEVLEGPAEEGVVRGVVAGKANHHIDVRDDDGVTRRFMPRWVGGMPADGGHLDEQAAALIRDTPVGATVELKWTYEERPRVTAITITRQPDAQPE